MKWFVSYIKDNMMQQEAIVADKREDLFHYLEEIDAKLWCVSPAKNFLRHAKPLRKVNYNPEVIATSKLAKVEIAAEDYNIGGKEVDGKHYFTHDEALEVQEKLKDTGWRLPTRSEWVLICEEFGQKDGQLDLKTLHKNLNMDHAGFIDGDDGLLYYRTTGGYWWSATRSSTTSANILYTNTSNVFPQNSYYRGYGFAVRLVRDIAWQKGEE